MHVRQDAERVAKGKLPLFMENIGRRGGGQGIWGQLDRSLEAQVRVHLPFTLQISPLPTDEMPICAWGHNGGGGRGLPLSAPSVMPK
jgi:hypothetical protein